MSAKRILIFMTISALIGACGNEIDTSERTPPESHSEKATPKEIATGVADIGTTGETARPAESEATSSDVRQADAHVHGNAALSIVADAQTLVIELDSPLYNLTGFEHEAETSNQIAALVGAEEALNHPEELFGVNGEAGCLPSQDQYDIHLGDGDHDHLGNTEHEDDAHSEEHGNDEELSSTGSHKDALIVYTFNCRDIDRLTQIDISLFDAFPNITELDVVVLGDDFQRAYDLSPANTRIRIR